MEEGHSAVKEIVELVKFFRSSNLSFDEKEGFILETMRGKYLKELQMVMTHVYPQFSAGVGLRLLVPIERHLFVAFALCDAARLLPSLTTSIAHTFVKGYSIPILFLNWLVDEKTYIPTNDSLKAIELFYKKAFELSGHKEEPIVLRHFDDEYSKLVEEIRMERLNAFVLPEAERCRNNIRLVTLLGESYYRSSSHYFTALLLAILSCVNFVRSESRQLGIIYGHIRQVTDEMVDWREDLQIGLISFPLQVALAENYDIVSELIMGFWMNTTSIVEIEKAIIACNGLKKAVDLCVGLYDAADALARKLFEDKDLYYATALFLEWKKAFAIEANRAGTALGDVGYIKSQGSQILRYLSLADQ